MNSFEGHILIQQGSESSLQKALISHKLNPNSKFKKESLLASAIKRNSPNLVKILLRHGGDPDLVSYENGRYEPAIITAVRYKSLACLQLLLDHGATVDKTNFYGTDAIFQAVHENAFDILDYLLQSGPPAPPPSSSWPPLPPSSPQPIVIPDGMMKETRGAGCSPLKIKESGHKGRCNDHTLCPFYYALNHSVPYACKRQSLVRLLQSYYKCKCLAEIASCTNSSSKTAGPPTPPPLCTPSAAGKFPHEELREEGNQAKRGETREEDEQLELRKCLMLAEATLVEEGLDDDEDSRPGSGYSQLPRKGTCLPTLDSGNGRDIKLQNGLHCVYKVYKIEGKCHAIKENESSPATRPSSSYVVLLGPLKLSCITREVIRDQIMLYASTTERSCISTTPTLVPRRSTVAARGGGGGGGSGISGARNFRKSLDTLLTVIPSPLMNFILYRNSINGDSNSMDIKLMKTDLPLNTKYFSIYIY